MSNEREKLLKWLDGEARERTRLDKRRTDAAVAMRATDPRYADVQERVAKKYRAEANMFMKCAEYLRRDAEGQKQ